MSKFNEKYGKEKIEDLAQERGMKTIKCQSTFQIQNHNYEYNFSKVKNLSVNLENLQMKRQKMKFTLAVLTLSVIIKI